MGKRKKTARKTRGRTRSKVAAKTDAGTGTRGRSGRRKTVPPDEHLVDAEDSDFNYLERLALVCQLFCNGSKPTDIKAKLAGTYKIRLSREAPYRYLAEAASKGLLQYVAPPASVLADKLRGRYDWLEGVAVVHTGVYDDVAYAAAEMLVALLKSRCREPYNKQELHIGWAGGHVMRTVAQRFAGLLRQPTESPLPEMVVSHALVAGFDTDEPTTAPNAFFTYFDNDPSIPVTTKSVGLHAPPIVESEYYPRLMELDPIQEAFSHVSKLDIIVTSVGSWNKDCPHSMLLEYMQRSPDSLATLEDEGYLGDMLWRPLGPKGPIVTETEIRAMTLIELSDLPVFIDQGKAVLLVVGPCRECRRSRTKILQTILRQEKRLVTHLVADSRTVGESLRRD